MRVVCQSMNFFEHVYSAVKKIPRGKVASYGMVAALCGSPQAARQVGWALHQLDQHPEVMKQIPWHRVINAQGYISTTCRTHTAEMQKAMLETEGVVVARKNRLWWVDLSQYLWEARLSFAGRD